jgi:hypothetical protein
MLRPINPLTVNGELHHIWSLSVWAPAFALFMTRANAGRGKAANDNRLGISLKMQARGDL